jgi:prophage DNA circulation protein
MSNYAGGERRVSNQLLEHRVEALERNLQSLEATVTGVQADMKRNTELTESVKTDTAEIVTIVKGMKIFGKVTAWAAAIASAWYAIRGFKL